MKTCVVCSEAHTVALGRALGALAVPGTVVALVGELGAGKTAFARGVGQGLGVVGPVLSPTFVLLQHHEVGRVPLIHGDLYRLEHPGELDEIGFDEALGSGAVVLVEWADLHPGRLPEDHLRVELSHALELGPQARRVSVAATGPLHGALLEALDV